MEKLIVNSYEDFASHLGEVLGTSEWLQIDSVLPYLWDQIIEVKNIKMLVNYGIEHMRFGKPVITGSRVRLVTKLHQIQNLRGTCKTEIDFRIEIEGERKPALEGIAVFLYYFN